MADFKVPEPQSANLTKKNACQECGATDCFEVDQARGDSVCTNCGSVQTSHQSQFIVSTVEFQESGGGVKQVVGRFVDSDGFTKFNTGLHGGVSMDSKANSFANARRIIEGIAMPMHIPYQIIDMAHNFYKMCFNRSMTRGRKLKIFCSACIYIACRLELTSHMLSDFCGPAQTDVSTLGRYFNLIAAALNIKLPVIDPSLYIPRFAEKLDLGDRTNDISRVAINLISGMQRDWMSTGRRPSGLCASALLIASRLYGFHRTVNDILKIFRIHKSTLIRRLEEFIEMPSSSLSYNDTVNMSEELSTDLSSVHSVQNPPCMNQTDEEDLALDEAKKEKIQHEIMTMTSEIDDLIDKHIMKKESSYKQKDLKDTTSEKTRQLMLKNADKDLLDEVIASDLDDSEIENAILDTEEVNARHEIFTELMQDTSGDKNDKTTENDNQNDDSSDDNACDDQNLDEIILKQLQQDGSQEPKRLKIDNTQPVYEDGPINNANKEYNSAEYENSDVENNEEEDDDDLNNIAGDPSTILANAPYL